MIKRTIDVIMSLLGILVALPIMAVIALAIFLQDFRSPFFICTRVGKDRIPFKLIKFRSMPVGTPIVESNQTGKLQITFLGGIIRRTNFDELPQFLNILFGHMSIVGPRPALESQVRLLSLREKNGAMKLRPGLTGWAQVNSYDSMSEEIKAQFDGEYAVACGLVFDLRIILRTFGYLLRRPPTY